MKMGKAVLISLATMALVLCIIKPELPCIEIKVCCGGVLLFVGLVLPEK